MEWPTIEVLTLHDENHYLYHSDGSNDPCAMPGSAEQQAFLADLTATLLTKEIYARAANAALSNITLDHEKSGLKSRVKAFLKKLRDSEGDGDDDGESGVDWKTEYRNIARDFTELMATTGKRSLTLQICKGGLDAVHDLLKYKLPAEVGDDPTRRNETSDTVLAARDAFVLCQSFPKLSTHSFTGTRAPDLEYRYGLLRNTNNNDAEPSATKQHTHADDSTVFGMEACHHVRELRESGWIETSAASLAHHTLTNVHLVSQLANRKTFVVLGCDHPLSPTKALLRIPGVRVLGIPTSPNGLRDLIGHASVNTPDDTTFLYPTIHNGGSEDPRIIPNDGNLILSRGPHVAQWILDNTPATSSGDDSELVLVPMPLPKEEDTAEASSSTTASILWAASSDLIVQRVLRARSESIKCSMWSYQSSTTCMVVPATSTTKSHELLNDRPVHEPWLHSLSGGRILTPAMDETSSNSTASRKNRPKSSTVEPPGAASAISTHHDFSIVNGIVTQEGPHHMLAEHIRMWRALVTHFPDDPHFYFGDHNNHRYEDSDSDDEDEDDLNPEVHVFAPHVPLLRTDVEADTARQLLGDLEVFDAPQAASLLCAIALAGLVDPIVNRPLPQMEESTPFSLFWTGSVHGGIWNAPYTLDSVSGVAGYLLGKAYGYYQTYSGVAVDAVARAAATAKGSTASAEENGMSKAGSDPSIVDAVPAVTTESRQQPEPEIPDIVQERLEVLA